MSLHPIVFKIRSLLEENAIPYSYFEHSPVRTSQEAHALRPGYTLSQGAKALIMRIKLRDGSYTFVQCIIPADRKIDGRKVQKLLDGKSITFATEEESSKITDGIEFGGIPPFGNLFKIPVYVDPLLFQNEEILFNCGDRSATIIMKSKDWEKLVQPTREEISK
jgi:Ala-tRNA(Pro) deacylase